MIELKSTYNSQTTLEDYINKPSKRPKLKPRAFCSSTVCTNNGYHKLGTEKIVSLNAVDCPDCKSSLYWTRDPHDFAYL